MICKHCNTEVESFTASLSVIELTTVTIIESEPYVDNRLVIEYPSGKPFYRFRCMSCGGDLNEEARECHALLRRGKKSA